ncbi:hypothetical protein [Enterobacter phage 04_vB_Eclo_IJM]|nr:hypothetical protein [Enterobacter phage 04_vB_Eclo_IJM]
MVVISNQHQLTGLWAVVALRVKLSVRLRTYRVRPETLACQGAHRLCVHWRWGL